MTMMMVIPTPTVIPATIRHDDTAAQQHGDAGNQQKGLLHRVHLLGFNMKPSIASGSGPGCKRSYPRTAIRNGGLFRSQ